MRPDRGRRAADNVDASIDAGPEAVAVGAANSLVLAGKVIHADAVVASNRCAGVASLHKIELVVIVDHAGLRRRWHGNT